MIGFKCQCGRALYFESTRCEACGSTVGFDPSSLTFKTLEDEEAASPYQLCSNGANHGICNWVTKGKEIGSLCFACKFNRFIPNLSNPRNLWRWGELEKAKKRLFFTLLSQGVPLIDGWQLKKNGLLFDFLEDQRSNDYALEPFVSTGHANGVITINILEAEPVARAAEQMAHQEKHRSLLGHLRHESGHYFWYLMRDSEFLTNRFEKLFDSPNIDYDLALESYYGNGAQSAWWEKYITPYASSHPFEDWAETWSHYLHLIDGLETATHLGFTGEEPLSEPLRHKLKIWEEISSRLDELNRSLGVTDHYHFSVNELVAEKLEFVETFIQELQTSGLMQGVGQKLS